MPTIISKGSKELKEQAPSPRSLETCRKLFVFVARKQDILLGNVQIRRKLELSSGDVDISNKGSMENTFS